MFINRRKYERNAVERYCTLSLASGRGSFMCRVTNISESGMGVDMEENIKDLPELNSEVVVQMDDEEFGSSTKKAVVIWLIEKGSHKPGATAGLEFI